MLLSARGELLVDKWRKLTSSEDINNPGDIIVSWPEWSEYRAALAGRSDNGVGEVALSLSVDDQFNDVLDDINQFSLVILIFDSFADGRHFSHATMIKRAPNFYGELRAAGNIHRDQLAYLKRVGFDSFLFESEPPTDAYDIALKGFSGVYQAAADGRKTVRAVRMAQ
jgi:uncharacterized protein (DUF934 family)